jgi:hypothetical protein
MKKILALLIVAGLLIGSTMAFAATDRDRAHKFRAFSSNTEGLQSMVLYRITGYASAASAVFGIYNEADLEDCAVTNLAVEGGEATQYDSITMYDFGPEGLDIPSAVSIIVSGAVICLEYE